LVVPAGNAPASSGYQPGALLLSYGTLAEGVVTGETDSWKLGVQMRRPRLAPILLSRQVPPAYICLPSERDLKSQIADFKFESGCQTWTRTKTSGLTGRRATLTPPGNGAADRIPTCIVPFRRRMPHVFDHGSNLNLVAMAGWNSHVSQSVSPGETIASR
jgi:hypothetical protein